MENGEMILVHNSFDRREENEPDYSEGQSIATDHTTPMTSIEEQAAQQYDSLINPYGTHRDGYKKGFAAGAAYERERAWVKVSERLPEEEGYYLVYYTIQAMDMVYKYEEVFYYSKGEWSQGGEDVAEPLFWMPLPNPPQHNTTEIK
jgi:hypothetical protein